MLRIILAAAALAATSQAAPLSPARSAELRDQFLRRQQATRSWTASFTQTVSMPGMRKPVVSEGTIAYKAPGQLRLDFSKPEGDLVIVTGGRVFIQKAGKRPSEKSLDDDRAGKPFESLLGLLGGKPTEDESLYDPELSREGADYTLVLTRKPSASSRLPRRITNSFDAESLEVREVIVELPNKGTIAYRFTESARNRAMDSDQFKPPQE